MANESIDKILGELKKVELILRQFNDNGKIPDIERDIILSKLRNMYEIIHLVQLQEVDKLDKIKIQREQVKEIEPKDCQEKAPSIPEPISQNEVSTLIGPPIEINTEKIEEQIIVAPISQKVTVKPEPSATILAEKFQQDKNFLNEALANYQHLQNLSKKYQTKPIKDIFSAISLNDKYLYIKELFNNDGDLYKKTIEILNNSGDFDTAIRYIDEHFRWDFNDFQVQKIMELVHRRYMPSDE